jgi:hypothetical protein
MDPLSDRYAFWKARDLNDANLPLLEGKLELSEALLLDVYKCSNPDCRQVALRAPG